MGNGKACANRDARKALERVKRIRRELADWQFTTERRKEKEREIVAIRAQFNL